MTESVGEPRAEERRIRTVRVLLGIAAVGVAAQAAGLWAARPGGCCWSRASPTTRCCSAG
ncbi:hypothetical protein ACFQ60_32110 [Streptomyces zhihengii]